MSADRRYSDKEIAKIFKQAAKAQEEAQSKLTQNEGLTLEELQQIGGEAGITPEFIAQAAGAIDRPPAPAQAPLSAQAFGITYSVGKIVDLPDHFGDEHWEQLVVDLRATFHAQGKVQRHGSLREWSNGNLRASVEPSGRGKRLRLTTKKGSALGLINGGIMYALLGIVGLMVLALVDIPDKTGLLVLAAMMSVVGVGMFGGTLLTVPAWAKTRRQQMDELAARAVDLAGPAPGPATLAKGEPLVASPRAGEPAVAEPGAVAAPGAAEPAIASSGVDLDGEPELPEGAPVRGRARS